MLTKSILPIFIFFHALLALELAELVRPGIANDLSRRTVVAGGWPLFVDSCPSDTQGCNPDYCCPSSLECGGFNTKYCCPDSKPRRSHVPVVYRSNRYLLSRFRLLISY